MSQEDEREILQRRILEAKKYWHFFLAELPLQEENLSLANQASNTEDEISPEINSTEELHIKYKFLLKTNLDN
jgi:hypothetical protein